MTMKEDAAVLRECAEMIEKLGGFQQHVDALRESAEEIDPLPSVDRSLRGWVLVESEAGRISIRWASEKGVGLWKDGGVTHTWRTPEELGWTVRKLTPEDIGFRIRRWDEWTADERSQYRRGSDFFNMDADLAIDIATRQEDV